MVDCIFCQIATNQTPAWKVHETDMAIAFLDVAPVNEYHTLVIPKRHFSNIFDIPAAELTGVILALKEVIDLYHQSLGLEHLQIVSSSGIEAQQEVFHFHFHIVPRHRGDGQDIQWSPHPEMKVHFDDLIARLTRSGGKQAQSK